MADETDPQRRPLAPDPADDQTSTQSAEDSGGRPRYTGAPNRRALTMVVAPIIGLVIAGNIGNALAPQLLPDPSSVDHDGNPLALLALTPQIRNQLAVVNFIDPFVFVLVGTLRLLAPDPFFFLLGRWYGDAAIHWMERRSTAAGDLLRTVERWFSKAGYVLVFVAPNNLICLLAGASRMRAGWFWALNIAGTVTRLVIIIQFGALLSDQIDAVLGFIGDYRPWILALTVSIVGVAMLRQMRRGSGELGQLRRLEHELNPDDHHGDRHPGRADEHDDRRGEHPDAHHDQPNAESDEHVAEDSP